ncbi:MAG: AbrB/MazE/SpoVT family DNA-binding domain-containing protein [Promethearchaeota archaeon]
MIKIGNSQGIHIPKHILEWLNIKDEIELVIDDNLKQIYIRSLDIHGKN